MFCLKCGAEVKGQFCNKCGTKVGETQVPVYEAVEPTEKKKSKKPLIIAIIAAVVVLLGVAAFLIIRNSKKMTVNSLADKVVQAIEKEDFNLFKSLLCKDALKVVDADEEDIRECFEEYVDDYTDIMEDMNYMVEDVTYEVTTEKQPASVVSRINAMGIKAKDAVIINIRFAFEGYNNRHMSIEVFAAKVNGSYQIFDFN